MSNQPATPHQSVWEYEMGDFYGHNYEEQWQRERTTKDHVQWGKHAHGFVPAGETVKNLRPGVYAAEWVRDVFALVPQKITTDNLIRLPDSQSDFVIAEIEKFWTLKGTFKDMGLSHKRGFLLHGPPGSGKTSTISIVMQSTVRSQGVVFLVGRDEPQQWAKLLLKFREIEPDRPAVVILEDIDALIKEHSEAQVLSILDGEDSIDNTVYIATTNYPEELDGRMTNRPSRFDWCILIDFPNAEARRVYLESRKVPGLDLDLWVSKTEGFSIAHMKELLVRVCAYGRDLDEQVAALRKGMSNPPKSKQAAKTVGFGRIEA